MKEFLKASMYHAFIGAVVVFGMMYGQNWLVYLFNAWNIFLICMYGFAFLIVLMPIDHTDIKKVVNGMAFKLSTSRIILSIVSIGWAVAMVYLGFNWTAAIYVLANIAIFGLLGYTVKKFNA